MEGLTVPVPIHARGRVPRLAQAPEIVMAEAETVLAEAETVLAEAETTVLPPLHLPVHTVHLPAPVLSLAEPVLPPGLPEPGLAPLHKLRIQLSMIHNTASPREPVHQ